MIEENIREWPKTDPGFGRLRIRHLHICVFHCLSRFADNLLSRYLFRRHGPVRHDVIHFAGRALRLFIERQLFQIKFRMHLRKLTGKPLEEQAFIADKNQRRLFAQ